MITTEELTADRPDIDPDEFDAESGAVSLTGAAFDIDGDGILDTQSFEVDDALVVATDTDADGDADHVTIVDGDGEYSAWEFHRDADGREHWELVDEGGLDL